MAWVTVAETKARMPLAAYMQAFDKDATAVEATADAFCLLCLTDAESIARMRLGPAFGDDFGEGGSLLDVQLKSAVIALACWVAIKHTPLATSDPKSAFRTAMNDAMALLDRMKTDADRPQNAAVGRARPRASARNLLDSDGVSTQAFGRARDGKDRTSF